MGHLVYVTPRIQFHYSKIESKCHNSKLILRAKYSNLCVKTIYGLPKYMNRIKLRSITIIDIFP